ncbi:hypothetical protein ACWDTP_11450 [Mycobacterium sp. NPDC003449]
MPEVRSVVGGVCVGSGIAIGAYSGGWFLLLAVALGAIGIGIVAGALIRSPAPGPTGELVPVTVDLIDRSAPRSTIVAGEARPDGDAPFRFHTHANLAPAQVAHIVGDGRGELPVDALGTPGDAAVTEHRTMRTRAPAALTAVAAMWATMLVPPSHVWDLNPLTSSVSAAVPEVAAADPDARPLWQWYDEAIAHLRAESPEAQNALLSLDVTDTDVDVEVYLGADRMRVYAGDADGWETSETTTPSRSRDTFTIADLQEFSARDFLAGAATMLPPDHREASRLEIERKTDDIFGVERPVLAEGRFGDPSIPMDGKMDGTIAAWWPQDDVAAGLHQVEAALAARGIATDAAVIKEVDLSADHDFTLDFYRGVPYYRTRAHAGRFASADDLIGEGEFSRFRFADVSADVLSAARDDAMRRYDVDPVDRGKADITIGEWGSEGGDREDEVVIEVDYNDAHGGAAVYSLSGEYLAG